ncbi:DUF302 domain-containing protein [Sulfurimonas sediminis]|uniref:DUF302 domain-containing protein n=1 Tax=Sulfurimonas sediminis TaxID=2590020 RepID=A0A7M1B537_9BACT|nr:DUF302 domain-containing protein [Sulfurimonas sediminis]QOP44606.1 DUF302 domain-containing protein [Sulfurimonas sediminis]
MKKIYTLIMVVLATLSINGCNGTYASTPSKPVQIQDVQVFTTHNTNKKVTPKTIEAAFDAIGLSVPGNNDMNKPFKTRFGKVHYKIYNLAMYINSELTYKIIRKYPKFGALTPLTMSIWEDKDGNMNIATLTLNGMSRATGVPKYDPDLVKYAALIQTGLKKAMPDGHFKDLNHTVKFPKKSFAIDLVMEVDPEVSMEDFIEDFEAEFEGELEPLGFLFPNYTNLQEEIFDDYDFHAYDFFHTYSICKFDVIYPVSKLHPEAGAWAPCSFYLYKKKNETKMYMGFLGVENWINTLDIQDEESIRPLKEAQGMIVKILKEMTE